LIPQLEILVFLRTSRAFSNLLFEELEILLDYLEVVEHEDGEFQMPLGFSMLFEGDIIDRKTGHKVARGSVVDHSENAGCWVATGRIRLLFISTNSTNTLFRKEPELALMLTDRLKLKRDMGYHVSLESSP
jgi:hypothetical protein